MWHNHVEGPALVAAAANPRHRAPKTRWTSRVQPQAISWAPTAHARVRTHTWALRDASCNIKPWWCATPVTVACAAPAGHFSVAWESTVLITAAHLMISLAARPRPNASALTLLQAAAAFRLVVALAAARADAGADIPGARATDEQTLEWHKKLIAVVVQLSNDIAIFRIPHFALPHVDPRSQYVQGDR